MDNILESNKLVCIFLISTYTIMIGIYININIENTCDPLQKYTILMLSLTNYISYLIGSIFICIKQYEYFILYNTFIFFIALFVKSASLDFTNINCFLYLYIFQYFVEFIVIICIVISILYIIFYKIIQLIYSTIQKTLDNTDNISLTSIETDKTLS